MTSLALLSIVLFATTHVDDLLLLLSFYANRSVARTSIVVGQYLGVILLLAIGLLGSAAAVALPPLALRLLGVIPIVVALAKVPAALKRESPTEDAIDSRTPQGRHIWGIASLTLASGGDNLGLYLPLFATQSSHARMVIVAVFLAMTAVWCAVAQWLAHHRLLQPLVRRWGHRLLPIVLLAVGLHIVLAWP